MPKLELFTELSLIQWNYYKNNELVVFALGSPMWTDYAVMGKFETGRVYVVYQDKQVTIIAGQDIVRTK